MKMAGMKMTDITRSELIAEVRRELQLTSNIYNPKFWPRAFAVLGHQWAAHAVILGAFLVLFILFAGIGAMAGAK
jgi:hypothetical protein